MQASVVIPVYNAEPFLREAVESALAQPEAPEIILVEDGSTDASPQLCEDLASGHQSVRLVRHAGNAHRGVSASRNTGIRESTGDTIAFLDADDRYLPDRFKAAFDILARDSEADGVYEATAAVFEDDSMRAAWLKRNDSLLTTLTCRVGSDELFEALVSQRHGHLHLNGLTVRRSALHAAGSFDEELPLGEDTHLWTRLAAVVRLVPGRLHSPVALRRFHAGNTLNDPAYADRRPFRHDVYRRLFHWGCDRPLPVRRIRLLAGAYLGHARRGRRGGRHCICRLLWFSLAVLDIARRSPSYLPRRLGAVGR